LARPRPVYRLERNFEWIRRGKVYKTSSEIEYGISSLSTAQAAPAKILRLRRQHWLIETGLHYRRDVTFHEDRTRMTIGAAGRILATVHNLVLVCSNAQAIPMLPRPDAISRAILIRPLPYWFLENRVLENAILGSSVDG